MNCEQMQNLFSPYLDKVTSVAENTAIEEHLGGCESCARQMEEMSRMVAMLKKMDTPKIPDGFGAELHNRINNEKIKHFPERETYVPKKASWMAAAVASVALSIGIFASSYLPYGAMVASLQDWLNKDSKPSVAVVDSNKIIQDWIDKQLQQNNTGQESTQAPDPSNQTGDKTTDATKPNGNTTGNQGNTTTPLTSNPTEVAVQDKVEQNYTAKIQVADMDKSMQDVMQLAYASGSQISVKTSNVMAAVDTVKVVTLQVPQDKAGEVLDQLSAIGVDAPIQNDITYTKTYADNQKTLATLDNNIAKLQESGSLSEQQQDQLQSLQKQRQSLQAEQDKIDKEIGSVTIELRLLEKAGSLD
ncbi:MAG TPA: zf-HC2 domain-containing protein [Syntrophomonas sp.]|nr:zf-HC2 domain-containing protein [Syntrophomonas sp.]